MVWASAGRVVVVRVGRLTPLRVLEMGGERLDACGCVDPGVGGVSRAGRVAGACTGGTRQRHGSGGESGGMLRSHEGEVEMGYSLNFNKRQLFS